MALSFQVLVIPGLKILLFLLLWGLLWLPIAVVLGRRLQWHPRQGTLPFQKLPLVASLYCLAPLVLWVMIHWEGRPLSDYGWQWQPPLASSLGLGWLLGLGSLALVFGLETIGGWIQWRGEGWGQWWRLLVPLALLSLWIGLTEEFIFRGLFLTQLSQNGSGLGSAVLISLLFALLHLFWERPLTLPQLPGLWLMGMVLAMARGVDDGGLGIAWGLHSAWVFGLASLDAAQLLHYPSQEGNWLLGKGNQPLAGVAGLLCLGMTGVALWWLFPQAPWYPTF
ncbi:CPBP family intramembrane glutamic endopeptidase [Synechocystis sp. LKSZ1]|uniref:CPBP family intramembrane glutamic endopeptidase n=1 Tax=Synechocystis sp. LKSZ1 TaxID=3144951 RepID=UPI00336BF978